MLDRELFITTDLFETTTPKAHFINERCFGEDFAAWLRERLIAAQLPCSEPVQEDWGWVLAVTVADRTFTLGIGILDESIGRAPADWRVSLSYERFLNRFTTWLASPPRETFEQLFARLKSLLEAEPRFAVSHTEPDGGDSRR